MSAYDDWASFDSLYGGVGGVTPSAPEPVNAWYEDVYEWGGEVVGSVTDTAGAWLGSLLDFNLKKEQLGYKNQLAQQQAVLASVENEQNTGAVPLSPNYQGVPVKTGGIDKRLLIAGGLLAAYLLLK